MMTDGSGGARPIGHTATTIVDVTPRRSRRLALAALCALPLLPSSSDSQATVGVGSPKCRSAAGTTLAAGRRARLYSVPTRGPWAESSPESVRVLGCLYGSWPPLELGASSYTQAGSHDPAKDRINPEAVALAAPMAAYSTSFQEVDFSRNWVVVRDLRSGAVLTVAGAHPAVGVEPASAVTDIAVTRSGAVAWISSGRSLGGSGRGSEVGVAAPGGSAAVLDEGDGIDPESLQLKDGTLTWTDEGAPRSAPIP
jgi:hypothetical protein